MWWLKQIFLHFIILYRIVFLLQFLMHFVVPGDPVDMQLSQIKASGKTGLKFRLSGKCDFRDAEPVPANGVTFSIQLDTPTTKFSSKQVTVLTTDGTNYTVTNTKDITKSRFQVSFTAFYEYENKTVRCFPVGTCTGLELTTTTTETTSTTTTQAPTTPDPTIGTVDYLQNNGMESNFTDNWSCHGGCTLDNSSDSYTGALSARISNRDAKWKGISQQVNITGGKKYMLSGYVKLLDDVDYYSFEVVLKCQNDTGGTKYLKFGSNPMVRPGIWTELGSILQIPEGYTQFLLYIQCSGETAEYLADDITLKEFFDDPDWRMKAEIRIEQLRKADISISVSESLLAGANNLTLEIKQKKHKFAFGSVVGAEEIVSTDPIYQKYQDWFYEHFEWGLTGNALKWKPMENQQGVIDYETPTRAINAMRSRGIKVRGHCVFWGVDKHVPDWVKTLNSTELETAIQTRIDGVITNTSGLLEHWDVNNENLHGDFFERNTGDANITMEMFNHIHMRDPDVKLFLNDYGIIDNSYTQLAWAMKAQAKLFRETGVPVYGVGIQSHISADFHITVVKARLDKVAEAGLPLLITEVSMIEANETKKATALEELMTMYFSHPAIEGIILWGFWEGRIWKINATLVEGSDLTPNEAGLVYQRLFKETWRTQETYDVTDSNPIDLRGFKGEYEVKLKDGNTTVLEQDFVLDDGGAVIQLN